MSLESPPNFPVGGILEFPGVGNLSGAKLCFALIKTMSLESPPNFPVGGILEFPGVGNLSGAK